MSSDGPGPQARWKPGDVANGHVLGADNVWRPLPPQPHWSHGDIVNGHILGPTEVWRPLQSTPPQRKPWYKRPLGVTGIVVGSLFIFGMGSAMAGG